MPNMEIRHDSLFPPPFLPLGEPNYCKRAVLPPYCYLRNVIMAGLLSCAFRTDEKNDRCASDWWNFYYSRMVPEANTKTLIQTAENLGHKDSLGVAPFAP